MSGHSSCWAASAIPQPSLIGEAGLQLEEEELIIYSLHSLPPSSKPNLQHPQLPEQLRETST